MTNFLILRNCTGFLAGFLVSDDVGLPDNLPENMGKRIKSNQIKSVKSLIEMHHFVSVRSYNIMYICLIAYMFKTYKALHLIKSLNS